MSLDPVHYGDVLDTAEGFMDDIIFKSCMVPSLTAPCVFTTTGQAQLGDQGDQGASVTADHVSAYVPMLYEPSDPSKPSLQPGAGIYTSPLTVNVPDEAVLNDVKQTIVDVQHALRMPAEFYADRFKYGFAVYLTSGYARFSVRIWRRRSTSTPSDTYAVEVMRERGDRILVTRFFEFLAGALRCCHDAKARDAVVDGYNRDFTVDMFDWAPRRLPPDVLEALPQPSAEDIESGISSMVSLAGSMYDDVAVNGCASVAKLAAASDLTRRSMANSKDMIQTLLRVVTNCTEPPDVQALSLDTRSNAAVALAELVQGDSKVGAAHLFDVFVAPATAAFLPALASLCIHGLQGPAAVPAYMCLSLRTACICVLTAVVHASKAVPSSDDALKLKVLEHAHKVLSETVETAETAESTYTYGPLTEALARIRTSVQCT